ncbi:60S ribosomal protein l16 [Apiospora kogelbergensis]|uniref:60S ribosomal protein l16 n=1 Tax=Apiospora kogelbergensis TaxID=1337665 RepID=A0AAW0QB28_9PEZI
MSSFESVVIIDGKGHLLGRLASIVAKQLLSGQKIVVVRCEALNISGEFFRAKPDPTPTTVKYAAYLRKMTRYNPTRGGPFHFRAPSRIFYKAVRGMIPHKTARGAAALQRLKVFEGVPPPTTSRRRWSFPRLCVSCACSPAASTALSVVSATRTAGSTRMLLRGMLLEERRKAKSAAYYERKKLAQRQLSEAKKNAKVDDKTAQALTSYGY